MDDQIKSMTESVTAASRTGKLEWNKVTWTSMCLAGVVFLIAIPAVAFYVGTQYQLTKDVVAISPMGSGKLPGTNACTEEAKLCPDGSSVSRTGPNCEFASCPVGKSTGTKPRPGKTPVACTMDAKICPDGSAVGRTGPNCQFTPCPSPTGRPEVKGTAMIGPTCPVVQNPPQEGCADKPYVGSLDIWTTSGSFAKSISTTIYGTFQTELTQGTYIVKSPKNAPKLPALQEQAFTILPGKTTELAIKLDTGIR